MMPLSVMVSKALSGSGASGVITALLDELKLNDAGTTPPFTVTVVALMLTVSIALLNVRLISALSPTVEPCAGAAPTSAGALVSGFADELR